MSEIISGVVKGIVSPLMDKLVIPFIKEFGKSTNLDYKINFVPIENHFRNYFENTYNKLSYINTIALKNSQKLLKDVYIPLTIINKNGEDRITINSYPKSLIEKYKRILLIDSAGMGKSTLMKRLFLDIIEGHHGIPIFVELRRLSKNRTIVEEIQEQLNAINKDFDSDLLLELLAKGEFIIILDGYDEIDLDCRKEVTVDIDNFITKTSNNFFIITSRPEDGLGCFSSFMEFKIKELVLDEAFQLLKKYDNQGEISSLLIKKLSKDSNFKDIKDFLKIPLLVSLLFTAFEYKQIIPLKKHHFYKQIYEAYFESHDLSKGESYVRNKKSKLGIDDFECVLRYLAYTQIDKSIEYSKDELEKAIDEVKKLIPHIIFETSDFINDLTTSVPLFFKEGIIYKWAHKSIKEYFLAQFIYKDSGRIREDILLKIYRSEHYYKYLNIFDLYYDIDYQSFKLTILYELLKEYEEYSETFNHLKDSHIQEDLLNERISLTFSFHQFLIKSRRRKINDFADEMFKNGIIERPKTGLISGISSASNVLKQKQIYLLYIPIYKRHFIINMLYIKNNELFQLYKYSFKTKYDFKFNFEEENKPYPITDRNIANELNSEENFYIVNQILKYITGRMFFHETAIMMKNQIENELSKNKEENPLLEMLN